MEDADCTVLMEGTDLDCPEQHIHLGNCGAPIAVSLREAFLADAADLQAHYCSLAADNFLSNFGGGPMCLQHEPACVHGVCAYYAR